MKNFEHCKNLIFINGNFFYAFYASHAFVPNAFKIFTRVLSQDKATYFSLIKMKLIEIIKSKLQKLNEMK